MGNLPHITNSEWVVISVLWIEPHLTAAEIVKRVQSEKMLASTTVKTLLRRLIEKNAVGFTKDEVNQKLYYYYPLVQEQDCILQQSQHFLSLYFKDNIEKLFTTFVDNSDLSDQEIDSLRDMLYKKKEDLNE